MYVDTLPVPPDEPLYARGETYKCRYLLDLSEEETAAALGVRRGTVKSRLSRALGRLRDEVERREAEEVLRA